MAASSFYITIHSKWKYALVCFLLPYAFHKIPENKNAFLTLKKIITKYYSRSLSEVIEKVAALKFSEISQEGFRCSEPTENDLL